MKKTLAITLIIISLIGISGCLTSGQNTEVVNETGDKGLPQSLDQYYQSAPPQPPEYLLKMTELGETMMGISINIQQGDMMNAKKSYAAFYENYKNSAKMVPEWKDYYNKSAVEKMGVALDTGDIPGVFQSMGDVGAGCSNCHKDTMSAVWNKYNWKDFRKVMINTPNPEEPQLPWAAAKMKYLAAGFDGIGVNIKQGNQTGAKQSFDLFTKMFNNTKQACGACHATERKYYVSDDIMGMINTMGQEIDAGNLTAAENIWQGIGAQSCYACHVLHMPAQFEKVAGQ
jgi:cytochrome c556